MLWWSLVNVLCVNVHAIKCNRYRGYIKISWYTYNPIQNHYVVSRIHAAIYTRTCTWPTYNGIVSTALPCWEKKTPSGQQVTSCVNDQSDCSYAGPAAKKCGPAKSVVFRLETSMTNENRVICICCILIGQKTKDTFEGIRKGRTAVLRFTSNVWWLRNPVLLFQRYPGVKNTKPYIAN